MSKVILHTVMLLAVGLPALPVIAAPDGKALFESACVACHRQDGQGGIGLPLTKTKFARLSDDYLYKTIRNGRPGRIMPTFDTLSDAQVRAIIDYLRTWSGTESFNHPEIQMTGDAARGAKLFSGYCVNCHGVEGRGLGKGTGQSYSREREFKVVPPAVGNTGFLNSASDAMLKDVITNGRQGTLMAAFGRLGLDEQAINDLVVYLRSLQKQPPPSQEPAVMPNASVIVDSPQDFDTTLENLKQALSGYNFRVFPDRSLEKGLFPEWQENRRQMTIRYCNFNDLYDMLKIDPRLGVGLPCRITVVEQEDGQVQLIAMNMAVIARLFNNDQLRDYAVQLDDIQRQILEEVTF